MPRNCSIPNCEEKAIPLTNFCYFHISNEKNQVLFRFCTYTSSIGRCEYPILANTSPELCAMHYEIYKASAASNTQNTQQNVTLQTHPTTDPYMGMSSSLSTFQVNSSLHNQNNPVMNIPTPTPNRQTTSHAAKQPSTTSQITATAQPATQGPTYPQIPYQYPNHLMLPSRMYMSSPVFMQPQVVLGVPFMQPTQQTTTPAAGVAGVTTRNPTQVITNVPTPAAATPNQSSMVMGQLQGQVPQHPGQSIYQYPGYYPYSTAPLFKAPQGQIYATPGRAPQAVQQFATSTYGTTQPPLSQPLQTQPQQTQPPIQSPQGSEKKA